MATSKKRLYVSLRSDVEKMIAVLAKRDHVPMGTKASELLTKAVEILEDEIWDEMAVSSEDKSTRFYTHEEAWKV